MTIPEQPEQIKIRSRAQWLKLRRTGIGGSDIAAIMGINPYKTAADVASEKLHGTEQPETEPMLMGREMEMTIVRLFKKRKSDLHIYKTNVLYRKQTIHLATPDRFATTIDGQDLIIEIKNTAYWNKINRTMAAYQVQWYCYVCNCPGGYIAALEGGTKLHIQPIVRDEKLITTMINTAEQWWRENVAK